jgi:hypothetical protein
MNYFIPTSVVDDFFESPAHIRKFASTLEYAPDPRNNWPGVRSKDLSIVNLFLFNHVINKALSIFYYSREDILGLEHEWAYHWEATAQFQMVSKESFDIGWVHKDSALITGIIYLNENPNPNSGTSIYDMKDGFEYINSNVEQAHNAGRITKEQVLPALLENNGQFQETITVKNKYNRLIMFDSNLWHGAQEYKDTTQKQDGDRLTLVFFINKFSAKKSPIYRMRNYN